MCSKTTDVDLYRIELQKEINLIGIDTVLDMLFEYRAENGVDSDDEE